MNLDLISGFFVFHGLGQIELLNVAWVFQEAGMLAHRPAPDPK